MDRTIATHGGAKHAAQSNRMTRPSRTDAEASLESLQRDAFAYFMHETNPANGLVADKSPAGEPRGTGESPASIAAVGFALAAYLVGVERGWMTRAEAVERTLAVLRFFRDSPQGPQPNATGYKGLYYHFLDMRTGRRVGNCELSTVDSGFLLAGALAAAVYFDHESDAEQEIRALADSLYRLADWQWALNGEATLTHGWKPESGFLGYRWKGYDEALLLYALGLGSPTYPLPDESYAAWASTYQWMEIDDDEFLYHGSLFAHQFSHLWIDFRGIQDAFMRGRGIDYFENSRRATHAHQQYAIRNPLGFEGYGPHFWGLTAGDGPGWVTRRIHGIERRFFDYVARGIPNGPDDGTVAPWAVIISLPFAPDIVLPTVQNFKEVYPELTGRYCMKCSFNLTFSDESRGKSGWTSDTYYGVDLGPIVLMLENYHSDLLWSLMRRCPYVVTGLRRAGFANGWL